MAPPVVFSEGFSTVLYFAIVAVLSLLAIDLIEIQSRRAEKKRI